VPAPNLRPAQDELAQLAAFQRRHRVSLLSVVCIELAGVARLKQQMGDAPALRLLHQHEQVLRDLLAGFPGGLEVSSGNGAFFLVFEKPSDAVKFALELDVRVALLGKKVGQALQERVGVHVGEVLVEVSDAAEGAGPVQGLNGIQVDICQAVLSLAAPGQVLMTRFAYDSARQALRVGTGAGGDEFAWANHGDYQAKGFDESLEICEVAPRNRMPLRAPAGNDRIQRVAGGPDLTEITRPIADAPFLARVRGARRNERNAARTGAAVVAFVGALFLVFQFLDGASYDWAYALKSTVPVADVVIVAMDDDAHRDLRQETSRLWSRNLHAQLVDRLTAAGAKAIGFDVHFDSPAASEMEKEGYVESSGDRALRLAFERSGRVVLGAALEENGVKPPSPLFRKPGRWGLVEWAPDPSSPIRQPIHAQGDVATFSEALAGLAGQQAPPRPEGAWLNYYGPPGTIRHLKYSSALSASDIPANLISNKIVLVGEAALLPPARDRFASPYPRWRGAEINGVEVNATAYLNRVRGDWLRRLPWWVELPLVLLFGVALGYALVFLEPPKAVAFGLAGALAIGVGATTQVWFTKVWFPWLVPAAVQLPLGVLWAVIVRTRLVSETDRQLRRALATHPRGHAAAVAAPSGVPSGATPPAAADSRDGTLIQSPEESARAAARFAVPPVPDHRMIRCIGKGAYGEVWVAEDIIGEFKAVKIIRRAAFANQAPFEREFRGLQKFTPISRSHPSLVHILHVGRNDETGFIYYIMEAGDDAASGQSIVPESYVPRSMGTDVERHGSIGLARVLQYGIEIGEAVAHLHRHGLIHRDIKPGNIIFVNDRPKLADIGLVTDIAAPGQEVTYIGTQGYMPPEGHGTPSADVFSLGKLLYVALTARSVQNFPDVPDGLAGAAPASLVGDFVGVLRRACEQAQPRRYQTAEEFVEGLRAIQSRLPGGGAP